MAESHATSNQRPADETIKETIEAIVIALILAFVFRAYVVEAFVIPTGSMAPTLLGAHIHVRCEQCGYEFDFGPPGTKVDRGHLVRTPTSAENLLDAVCPMCLAHNGIKGGTPLNSGDRILVHKYIYSFSEPRRWDVVVFKAPHEPATNYIKRLVGLPNEQLYIFDGNIYVHPLPPDADLADAPDANQARVSDGWRIARKTERPSAQRAVWQPIYNSDYIPRDLGQRRSRYAYDWQVPWRPRGATAEQWRVEHRRSYRYEGGEAGAITFDFPRSGVHHPALVYPYNQFESNGRMEPIEDIRVAAHVQPLDRPVAVTISTTARLDNADLDFGVERLSATIAMTGEVTLQAQAPGGGPARVLDRARIEPLPVDAATAVELWYADQEASLWVDGRRVIRWRYDLPLATLLSRERPAARPQVAIEVSGGPVALHDVELDRDLFYGDHMGSRAARGALLRADATPPVTLGGDEFFCLGDNGPQSSDSRFWNDTDAWIDRRMFAERDAAHLEADGIVPRDLMMGRAFFVYFPAPYPAGIIPLPNFGDMRFIR